MCWNIPASVGHGFWGELSTVTPTSSGLALKISKDQLQPGDAVGFLGEGSDGPNGHVVLFAGWVDGSQTHYWAYEQHGPTKPALARPGPPGHQVRILGRPNFFAYQYRDIAGTPPSRPLPPSWPGRIFRSTPGKPQMHGEDIRRWQQQMRNRGWKDTHGHLLEGDSGYGELSADVCRKFEAQKGLPISGEVGPIAWTAPVTPD
jgi:hypothetical protein